MRFGDYLKQYQPLVYETFKNSVANERIAHAYLLSGESGVPLLETATFLAKSLICDHPNPLADEECRSCLRIDHHTYSDFIVLDGKEGQIKIDLVVVRMQGIFPHAVDIVKIVDEGVVADRFLVFFRRVHIEH